MDDVERVDLKTHASRLKELYLPKTVLGVDFLVSLPKLKTHHWAGVTLSLKNMFGVVPGGCYGWPKNHASLGGNRSRDPRYQCCRPARFCDCGRHHRHGRKRTDSRPAKIMRRDGVRRRSRCSGCNLRPNHGPVARKNQVHRPGGTLLGHIQAEKIQQLGESIESTCTPFAVLEAFRHLRRNASGPVWNLNCP